MVSSLDSTTVTNASSRVVELRAAFEWITQTCQPEILYESYELMKTTLDRFQAAREELKRAEAKGLRVETAEFFLVFTKFYAKVHSYSTMAIADRVVNANQLINTLKWYHGDHDGLSKVFELLRKAGLRDVNSVGPEEFHRAEGTFKEKLKTQIDRFIANAQKDLVDKKSFLDEAERVLVAAEGSHDPLKWSQNDLARAMKEQVSPLAAEALTLVANSSKPSWYMNEKEVKCEKESFASGSFGSVHYGTLGSHDDEGGPRVVVKRLTEVTEDSKRAFVKEVDLWAQLRHPYILRLIGACHSATEPWLACECADKGTLLDYLASPIGKKRKWRLLYETALAIKYLHGKSIVHADLKLDNFLVGSDGYVRVTDFGMSRLKISSNAYATSSKEAGDKAVGALRFRAPECVGDNRVSAQLPSDVYSFGKCLYAALSGMAPYGYLDETSAEQLIQEGKVLERPAEISDDTAWALIVKMTDIVPHKRPTIQQVVRELWKFAEEEQKNDTEKEKGLKLFCLRCKQKTLPDGCRFCGFMKSEKLLKIDADMVSSLDTTVVTDASSRVAEVRAAFEWITQTCQPEILYESYELMKTTLGRFQAAREELKRAEAKGLGVKTAEFLHVFTKFYAKVHSYSTMAIADRVVNANQLINTLKWYHGDHDGLGKVFQLLRKAGLGDVKSVGPEAFQLALGTYKEKLKTQIDRFIANAQKDLVDKKSFLDEAERVLVAAEGSHDPLKWSQNDLARAMKEQVSPLAAEALTLVANSSKPSWYMNEKEVKCEKESFASGSFGSVHYGTLGSHDDEGGPRVVVKRLTEVTEDSKRAFVKEVDLWAQLRHPYILRLIGACHSATEPWLACECADKGTLLDYLASPIGKKRKWRLLYETALAIKYLHGKSIVHADLKLDNFLVGSDGYVRVTDFGMSRLKISSNAYATSSKEAGDKAVGALRFRAPECVGDNRVSAQLPSDVYSFGKCLYAALSGMAPYGYLDEASAEQLIQEGKVLERPAEISDDTAWALIVKMTDIVPHKRPTIQQVVRELWKFAEEEQKNDTEEEKGLKLFCLRCKQKTLPGGCRFCGFMESEKLLKIESKADLPRVMELLTSQSEKQRLDAM